MPIQVMDLLKLFGVPYVVAPMEAEVRNGLCNATIAKIIRQLQTNVFAMCVAHVDSYNFVCMAISNNRITAVNEWVEHVTIWRFLCVW